MHGPRTDEPIVWYEGGGTTDRRFLHADARGSIIATSNSNGNGLDAYTYGPYGEPNSWTGSRFRYTGQIAIPDPGSGSGVTLYHYKARTYAPALGRFLQTDPIGYGDGMNLYAYVGNDPVNMADPTGMVDSCLSHIEGGNNCTGESYLRYEAGREAERDHTYRDTLAAAGAAAGGVAGGIAGGTGGGAAGVLCGPAAVACAPAGATAGTVEGVAAGALAGGIAGGLVGDLIDKGVALLSENGDRSTRHGEKRSAEARGGDNHRQVGDPNRVIREGRQFRDTESGAKVYVRGDKVVVVGRNGRMTQFRNPAANTQARIRSGRWQPL